VWIVREEGLIEPAPAPVYTVDAIGAVSLDEAGMASLYYVRRQDSLLGGEAERVVEVVVRLPLAIVPTALAHGAKLLEQVVAPAPLAAPRPRGPRLVK
jgi:hypothetical protein